MKPTTSASAALAVPPTTYAVIPPTRREFLQRLGAGLLVWIALSPEYELSAAEGEAPKGPRPRIPTDFNAFLRIGEDGRVTGFTGKIEMGQGPITSLPQMLAEELDVPLERVDIVMGDTELCPYDAGTWGSLTTRSFGPLWRAAAAEARGVLLELGAAALQLPLDQVTARDGFVCAQADAQRRVAYGALTQGKRIERRLSVKPDLKKPAQFKLVGRPLLRRDAREKVTGQARYTGDLRLPGQLYARLVRPPAHGAEPTKIDLTAARAIPGVVVVEKPDLVAVLHPLPDVAEAALDAVKASFQPSPSHLASATHRTHLARLDLPKKIGPKAGDLAQGASLAVKRLDDTYYNPYVAHAAMETHTALAQCEGGKATVWASTQNPFGARDEIAKALDLPPAAVRVITPFVGGGFGGKSFNQQAVEAARLAQATGRPVQVMWTREEEFFLDTFRPAAVVNIQSGLDAQGRMVLWDYEVRFAGDRGSDVLYDIPHHRISSVGTFNGAPGAHPFRVGAWRAPGCNTNAFARECHVSRLAELAGVDPIEFRLRQLQNPRAHRVLAEAAKTWGWQPAAGRTGRGLGVAIGMDTNTYVATIAEVAVDRATGKVAVKRVLCVQEMGLVVNPAGATIQMEGCITMGLGYALTEEVRFRAGVVEDTNFNTYPLPRFSWLPKIETKILPADDLPPYGGGEPAIIVMGAVLANAVYDATGARLTELPLTPERVKAALAAVPAR